MSSTSTTILTAPTGGKGTTTAFMNMIAEPESESDSDSDTPLVQPTSNDGKTSDSAPPTPPDDEISDFTPDTPKTPMRDDDDSSSSDDDDDVRSFHEGPTGGKIQPKTPMADDHEPSSSDDGDDVGPTGVQIQSKRSLDDVDSGDDTDDRPVKRQKIDPASNPASNIGHQAPLKLKGVEKILAECLNLAKPGVIKITGPDGKVLHSFSSFLHQLAYAYVKFFMDFRDDLVAKGRDIAGLCKIVSEVRKADYIIDPNGKPGKDALGLPNATKVMRDIWKCIEGKFTLKLQDLKELTRDTICSWADMNFKEDPLFRHAAKHFQEKFGTIVWGDSGPTGLGVLNSKDASKTVTENYYGKILTALAESDKN